MSGHRVRVLTVAVLLMAGAGRAAAQDPAPEPPEQVPSPAQPAAPPVMSSPAWRWSAEASAFAGYNYQHRKFTDFDAWESQNWVMAALDRPGRRWNVSTIAMFTFEPFSLNDIGSPQAFQTGETFNNAPIIDYQHPHDLIMQLSADVTHATDRTLLGLSGAVVGTPPIGPPPFMHRPSATENPQAPLGHHYLDSTHVTHGVITGSARVAGVGFEAGVFRGREPDEVRTDLDMGRLDSLATRVSWSRGAWYAQVSSAWLKQPERLSTYDSVKRTASVSHVFRLGGGLLSWMAAAGQNREAHGNLEAYVIEGTWRLEERWSVYSRTEYAAKDILDAGFHPVGMGHTHRQSPVGAFTIGATRYLLTGIWGALGLGADVTGYSVPANLSEAYGSPVSWHAFVRYRGRTGTSAMTHHQH